MTSRRSVVETVKAVIADMAAARLWIDPLEIDSLARCRAQTPPPTPAHKGRGNVF